MRSTWVLVRVPNPTPVIALACWLCAGCASHRLPEQPALDDPDASSSDHGGARDATTHARDAGAQAGSGMTAQPDPMAGAAAPDAGTVDAGPEPHPTTLTLRNTG